MMKNMKADQKQPAENALAQEFHFITLIRFALPTMVMMIFMGLYTIADTIFVSRLVNTNALSALNIVCPVINLTVGVGTMLSAGGSAVVAAKMGQGREEEARQDFSLIVLAGAVLGILIALLGIRWMDSVIYGLGANNVLFPYCRDYLFVILIFTPASMLQVLFQNLIVTAGKPGFGMVLSVSAGIANIILDYIFMGILKMGIRGSALGTGIGYLIPTVFGVLFFMRNPGTLRFCRPSFDWKMLLGSLSNGCSEMVSQTAAAVTTFLFNGTMMRLAGENGVAAVTIMIYTQFFLTTLYIGYSMGVAPVISYNRGRKNDRQLRRTVLHSLAFTAGSSCCIFGISMLFGEAFLEVFCPSGSGVYGIAAEGIRIFPAAFLFCGMNIFTSAMFTALSNGKLSALISFLRTFGLITMLLMILPKFFGITGVWMAVPIAEAVTWIVAVRLLWGCRGKYGYGG